MQKSNKNNRQVQRTKSWVFEALMLLMDEKPYDKITVSDITEKAGIARPTFYRNFDDKDDVVFEYLRNTFSIELLSTEKNNKNVKQNDIILVFDDKYMVKYQKNLKKILSTADIENRIYRHIQKLPLSFIKQNAENYTKKELLICRYKLCYQITGSLRVIYDWFINNMPIPVENIVAMLNSMNVSKTAQYSNILGIVIRLKVE